MPDMREVVDDLALQTSSLDRKGRVWQDGGWGKTESVARRRVGQHVTTCLMPHFCCIAVVKCHTRVVILS